MTPPLRVRASDRLRRVNGPSLLRTACLYAGAGLLTLADFRSPSIARWEAYDNDSTELEEWEDRVYRSVLTPSDRVLLIGCGTGRDLLALRQLGCPVTGLEQSPALAERARAHLATHDLPTRIVATAIESYDPDDALDAVVFSPYTYSYIHGTAARVATLARLKRRMPSNGRVILSYISSIEQSGVWILLARVASVCSGSDWWPERGDRLYAPASHPQALSFEHQFLPDEIAGELGAAGFRVVRDEAISPQFRFAVAVL